MIKTIHENTAGKITQKLSEEFAPVYLEVMNDSQLHAKHKEAKKHPKAGHYRVIIISAAFKNKSSLQSHRLIYQCLDDLMQKDIHALSIEASAPQD